MFGCRAPTDLEIPASRGLAVSLLSRKQSVSIRVSSDSAGLETCTYDEVRLLLQAVTLEQLGKERDHERGRHARADVGIFEGSVGKRIW